MIVIYEFFILFLFYDYIYKILEIVDIYLIWRKKEPLFQKSALYIIPLNLLWSFLVYLLRVAYYNEDLLIYFINILTYSVLLVELSFIFKFKAKNEKNSYNSQNSHLIGVLQ